MIDLWTLMASAICGAICWRIAAYRRRGARYRGGVSLCAYLLAAGSGCFTVSVCLGVLAGRDVSEVSPPLLLVLGVLLLLVHRANGNVAAVLQVEK